MKDDMDRDSSTISRQACQQVVRSLIKEYEWALLSEDELVALTLDALQPETSLTGLEELIRKQYAMTLYEACRQTADLVRRERAYVELFNFLYRAAYNRWPEWAEAVAQRALGLVYQQIDRCYGPVTFLGFAFNKLRQAGKEELRSQGKELSLEEIGQGHPEEQPVLPSSLDQAERLHHLVAAIKRLPDKRQQKVILLKFFGGLSDEVIGLRLGLTASNVRVLRHRGLARLREDEQLIAYMRDDEAW